MIAKCFCTYSEHIIYIWALISKASVCGVERGGGLCANVSLSASGYFNDIKNKVV